MAIPPPPKYVVLNRNSLNPPPHFRNLPRHTSSSSSSSSNNFCRCFCFSFLSFLLIIISISAYIYLYVDPKVPLYTVDEFKVDTFNILPDLTLKVQLSLTLTATNPNRRIAIDYEDGSSVALFYSETMLCEGGLPVFRQREKNTTIVRVTLTGTNVFGSLLRREMVRDKRAGKIPILVVAEVPAAVVGPFPKVRVAVEVNCSLVVTALAPGEKVRILSKKYKVYAKWR